MNKVPFFAKGIGTMSVVLFALGSAVVTDAQVYKNPNIIVPASSMRRPQDKGHRLHTNYLVYGGKPYKSKLPPEMLAMNHGPLFITSNIDGYFPADVRAAYNIPPSAGTGAIAVVDAFNDPTALADFNVFASQFNLPQEPSTNATANTNKVFQVVYSGGTVPANDQGWAGEISLDIEWAHAIAPNAKIFLVETPTNAFTDLFGGVAFAGKLPGVLEVSQSFGSDEFSGENVFDSSFSQPGVVFFASAGDIGGLQSYPAESPFVVGVGGTSVEVNSAGSVLSETAWSDSGGGPSAFYPRPGYQSVVASKTGSTRGCPDVSAIADPETGVACYGSFAFGGWAVIGGTSLASPVVAAITNVRQNYSDNTLDELGRIYSLYQSPFYRDITQGSAGSFTASVGWDFITGIGAPVGLFPQAVQPIPLAPKALAIVPGQAASATGNVTSVKNTDSVFYKVTSLPTVIGQLAAAQVNFQLDRPFADLQSAVVNITSMAPLGTTQQIYAFNWTTKTYDYLSASPTTGVDKTISFKLTQTYVKSDGNVQFVVRALRPTRLSTGSYSFSIDQLQVVETIAGSFF
jgi:subtilase family serine protease